MDILIPILFFVSVFGFFEALLFPNGFDYWRRPALVSTYFLSATVCALVLISSEPLTRVLAVQQGEVIALALLIALLVWGVWVRRFSYSSEVHGSLGYVVAKTSDVIFQDTMAIIVAVHVAAHVGVLFAIPIFALYFFLIHALLFLILPLRYGVVFVVGSLAAGVVFGSLILFNVGVVYVIVCHMLFYVCTYPLIRKLRSQYYVARSILNV